MTLKMIAANCVWHLTQGEKQRKGGKNTFTSVSIHNS